MKQVPVLLAGATPLVTALGVRLARRNWPVVGLWDPDHARALTSSLRIGCCAFGTPHEPLAQAGLVILGTPDLSCPGHLTVVATFPGSQETAWLLPGQPVTEGGQDLSGVPFVGQGAGCELAAELGLICSPKGV